NANKFSLAAVAMPSCRTRCAHGRSNRHNLAEGKDMMREIEGVTEEPRMRRRWFHDEYFDLFVWETDAGDVMLFQLCYGTGRNEQALVWHRDAGLFHDGTEALSGVP